MLIKNLFLPPELAEFAEEFTQKPKADLEEYFCYNQVRRSGALRNQAFILAKTLGHRHAGDDGYRLTLIKEQWIS